MSLHNHKVKFKGKVYFKHNTKNGKSDLYNRKGELKFIGVREELTC